MCIRDSDNTVRLNNLRAGDLDIIERVAPSDVKAVKDDANLRLAPVTGLGFQSISVNLGNGARANNPLAKDKRVRQALDLAIDRDVDVYKRQAARRTARALPRCAAPPRAGRGCWPARPRSCLLYTSRCV